ncbi:hypothetical protein [Brevibacillus brevis]|uniref:hypothetical protein n=1 Tax=Brevibacillus brevis TaxID=1393 RepID=UPI00362B1919
MRLSSRLINIQIICKPSAFVKITGTQAQLNEIFVATSSTSSIHLRVTRAAHLYNNIRIIKC